MLVYEESNKTWAIEANLSYKRLHMNLLNAVI